MSTKVPSVELVQMQLTEVLDQLDLSWEADDGFIRIPFGGSTADSSLTIGISVITRKTILGELPFVAMKTVLVVGIALDGENGDEKFATAMQWVNDFNQQAVLLRAIWVIEEVDGEDALNITMEAELLATDLDPREVCVALSELEIAANTWDDKLAEELGGVTWAKALQGFTSQMRLPTDD